MVAKCMKHLKASDWAGALTFDSLFASYPAICIFQSSTKNQIFHSRQS